MKWKIALALASAITLPLASVWAAQGSSVRIQVVDARGLPVSGAVVEVEPAAGHTGAIRFPWHMAMAQKDQQFTPGTLVVAKGSTVAFPNLDTVRHSVFSFSKPARFEIDLYGRDQTRSQFFGSTGTVALGCNIHDNMQGFIRVVDTPYAAKTDRNGVFSAASVPLGAARVTVWHPRLRAPGNEKRYTLNLTGSVSRKVSVELR
ncbi:methylamine utilization protein [Qipengyuania atrilutea]|uniref:Methylamine utilization protein n=1 Tax=Qipengyuania atrilutea TaxID=2744473 RepID=A0A850GZH4_9SPHN|nr:methylamine utilization protein [Actirhodobacter atriluteus]NVD45031.1 methylamine utilization protein [Actirhodobacter atriluteus]